MKSIRILESKLSKLAESRVSVIKYITKYYVMILTTLKGCLMFLAFFKKALLFLRISQPRCGDTPAIMMDFSGKKIHFDDITCISIVSIIMN